MRRPRTLTFVARSVQHAYLWRAMGLEETARQLRRYGALAIAVSVTATIAACNLDALATVRFICRGDSTAARADTSLVRCSTLDSLAKRPDTTRVQHP